MHQREELSKLFDYESWATQQWIKPAQDLQCMDILLHIVKSQIVWLSRIEGRPELEPTLESFAMDLDRSVRAWQRVLLGADLGQVISYTRQDQPYENTILEIARHVINHGTYHRGHLRGIAHERKFSDFPETDYIAFCRERRWAYSGTK